MDGEVKRLPGRPPWNPTERDREQVQKLAGLGLKPAEIAMVLGVSTQTLEKHCGGDFLAGQAKAKVSVAAALFRAATDPTKPNVTAAIWLEKTRFGVRDPADTPKKVLVAELAQTAGVGSSWDGLLQ